MKQILILIISIMLIIANLRMIGSPSSFNSRNFSVFDTLYLDAPQDVVDKISAIQLQDLIVSAPKLASNEYRAAERDSDKLNVDLLETILHKVHDYTSEKSQSIQITSRFEEDSEDFIDAKPMRAMHSQAIEKQMDSELEEEYISKRKKNRSMLDDEERISEERIYQRSNQIPSRYSFNPHAYQYQQPPPMYQQFYQSQPNPMAQTAALAMQLQASAMAMQAQASALMMQAQQQVPIATQGAPIYSYSPKPAFSYEKMFYTKQMRSSNEEKQAKINMLLSDLQQLGQSSEYDIHRLLMLLDLEFDILEHLLARTSGAVIERIVFKRNDVVNKSAPLLVAVYDAILDLATQHDEEADVRLYHYFVRKGRKNKTGPITFGKKKFLMRMIYELEKYYEMIENMQKIISSMQK